MGYCNDTVTPHGFRATARTLLDEVLGYRVEWIEHQLAHAVELGAVAQELVEVDFLHGSSLEDKTVGQRLLDGGAGMECAQHGE